MIELPQAFMQRMQQRLGPEAPAFFACYDQPPRRGLRVNPLRLSVADFLRISPVALEPGGILPEGFLLPPDAPPLGNHPYHLAGMFYLQEPSAMAPIGALEVEPGLRVLDLCAAPGGKSGGIAARLAGQGLLVANEVVPGRAKTLRFTLERLGVANGVVTCARPDVLCEALPGYFHRVLVDAPCSGEGMFRKDPEAVAAWSPQHVAACAKRQQAILGSAAQAVAPGGLLVYSTCTFNALENEAVVEAFCQEQPDFLLERTVRLWPHRVAGEGHFAARLRRQGDAPPHAPDGPGTALDGVWDAYAGLTLPGRVETMGERVWLLPESLPELRGVRVLRAGLCLGERRGGRFLPDHAAAMALPLPGVSADAAAAARYLHGEALEAGGQAAGWTVVRYAGLALGWAKCADGVLKNHLPKGLRK